MNIQRYKLYRRFDGIDVQILLTSLDVDTGEELVTYFSVNSTTQPNITAKLSWFTGDAQIGDQLKPRFREL